MYILTINALEHFMKKTVLAIALAVSATSAFAQGVELRVVDVDPVYKNVTRYHTVVETRKVCYRERRSDGLLEKIVDGGFGSTEGLIGTGIGVAIGSEIGGGRGNDAAKIIGGLIGNRVGNNVARSNNNRCEFEDVERREPYTTQEISSYQVTVEMEGSTFNVNRPFRPQVGDYIPVQLRVQ
jgi:uncharacterized protein YcfJ